jgi:Uma2 family endonuclease
MGEAGVLPAEKRFELLDGEIYELMPPGPLHAFVVDLIREMLEPIARGLGARVSQQNPIRLSPDYDPQPDVAIIRQARAHRERFPVPAEVLLVVEVSDSSVEHDRELKLPAYAAAGIQECWLVNLPAQHVEIYRNPVDGEYRTRHIRRTGDSLDVLAAPGTALAAAELFEEPPTEIRDA